MAEVVIFAGPSLPFGCLKAGWIRLPPAGRGDILRVLLTRKPHAIGLIDGWIHDRPSVGHKEILLAISEGVKVLGSSGIGAIRAAELHTFGMLGVGKVYGAYAEGLIDGDDEVALATINGAKAKSVALIDVRATLQSAIVEGAVKRGLAIKILTAAKRLHYMERTYPRIIDSVRYEYHSVLALNMFGCWLAHGRCSVKEEDAHNLIDTLANTQLERPALRSPVQPIETVAWCRLYNRIVTECHEQSHRPFR